VDDRARQFLEEHHTAAMITLRRDGTPHVARVGIGLVAGKIWSSGTINRVRTRHLRRDPRSTLFVFESQFRWLGLECHVTLIDGPEVPQLTLRIFPEAQVAAKPGHVMWMGQEKTEAEFLQTMVDEGRIIYEFEPSRVYGMY
jgi:PPOX class probable F420-dependent enzyme